MHTVTTLKEVKHRRALTDDGDAAGLGDLHHLVHHVLGAVGEAVPLEHTHGSVPHDLLGAAHSLREGLGTLWSAVQTLGLRLGQEGTAEYRVFMSLCHAVFKAGCKMSTGQTPSESSNVTSHLKGHYYNIRRECD